MDGTITIVLGNVANVFVFFILLVGVVCILAYCYNLIKPQLAFIYSIFGKLTGDIHSRIYSSK